MKKIMTILLINVALFPAYNWAGNKALIVVVENYLYSNSIDSIEYDKQNAKQIMNLIGFKDSEIKALYGSPTKSQIIDSFNEWLVNGTGPGDAVVFYFSGHGTQVLDKDKDEDDKKDEAICPSETAAGSDGYINQSTIITDDELNNLIKKLKERKVLLLFDSCHSGTVSRNLSMNYAVLGYEKSKDISKKVYTKLLVSKDMTDYGEKSLFPKAIEIVDLKKDSNFQYIEFSAAQPYQKSYSIPNKGGAFTLFLLDGIKGNLANENNDDKITIKELKNYIDKRDKEIVQQQSNSLEIQDAYYEGTIDLENTDIKNFAGRTEEQVLSDFEANMENIINNANFKVTITTLKRSFSASKKEKIEFIIRTEEEGFLTLVEYQDGIVTLLFPNQIHPNDTKITNEIIIPTELSKNFWYNAAEPIGVSKIYAIISKKPLNAYKNYKESSTIAIYKIFDGENTKALSRSLSKDLITRRIGISYEQEEQSSGQRFGACKTLIEIIK